MPDVTSGSEQFTDEDRSYAGSRFRDDLERPIEDCRSIRPSRADQGNESPHVFDVALIRKRPW